MPIFLVFDLSDYTVISVGGVFGFNFALFGMGGSSLRTGMVLLWYGFFLFTLGYRVACCITGLIAQGPLLFIYMYNIYNIHYSLFII